MSNILCLLHPESDFGEAFLVNGIAKVFGEDNLYDWPVKESYHGTVHQYARPWCGEPTGTTAPLAWFTPIRRHSETEETIKEKLNGGFFDLVIVGSGRPVAVQTFCDLEPEIRASGAKIILHDGEDFPSFQADLAARIQPDVYLKRELLKQFPDKFMHGNILVLPFPFSCPDQLVPTTDRTEFDYSIAALLGGSWDQRKDLCDALVDVPGAYVAHGSYPNHETGKHGLKGFEEYIDILRRSRFGVSMRGYGWDSCRLTEVAVNSGLFTDILDIHYPNPFKHGINCIEYSDIEQAKIFAENIAHRGNDSILNGIRQAGIEHARKYHLNSSRVKWMLEHVLQ